MSSSADEYHATTLRVPVELYCRARISAAIGGDTFTALVIRLLEANVISSETLESIQSTEEVK